MSEHYDGSEYFHDDGLTTEERIAMARAIADQDTLELLTVGVDIGSSTSHLLFAKIFLKRQIHGLSSRFVVVDRTVVWRSPILLTPFAPGGTIDADQLRAFFDRCYADAGYSNDSVDSGAVILTGEAIKQANARAIDEIFASEAGKFVCATAGHRLESTLAAHGSGAAQLSKQRRGAGLHVDIGGGTTKLALIVEGEIVSVSAFAVGGRLVAKDDDGQWSRVTSSAALVAKDLGIGTSAETLGDSVARGRIAQRLATLTCDQILEGAVDDLGRSLELTEPLDRRIAPEYITLSGGVAEYVFERETASHGDIAQELAAAIRDQLARRSHLPVLEPSQRIRATVIGASQYTVQVSGKTIYLSDPDCLPIQNVPVFRYPGALADVPDSKAIAGSLSEKIRRHGREAGGPLAIALEWAGPPTYERLSAVAKAVATVAEEANDEQALLILAIEGDVGQSLGRILHEDFGIRRPLVSADGIELDDFDFIDIGEMMTPPGVVPLVIKSLLFA